MTISAQTREKEVSAGRIETFDIDEHADSMHPWVIEFDQLTPGPFSAITDYVQTPELLFYRQSWNRRLRATGATPPGYFLFAAPELDQGQVVWNAQEYNGAQPVVGLPASEIRFSTTETASHDVLLVRSDVLQAHIGAELSSSLEKDLEYVKPDNKFGGQLVHTIGRLVRKYYQHETLLCDERERKALEHELLDLIAENVCLGTDRPKRRPIKKRHRALAAAIEYVQATDEPVAIPRLADVAAVSQRTLEYAFVDEYGITPTRYVRRSRLNKLRRHLLDGSPDSDSVTRAAQHFGFAELGRLAGEYRRLFGELPSTTLARQRVVGSSLHFIQLG